jgi:hypothetical protein
MGHPRLNEHVLCEQRKHSQLYSEGSNARNEFAAAGYFWGRSVDQHAIIDDFRP